VPPPASGCWRCGARPGPRSRAIIGLWSRRWPRPPACSSLGRRAFLAIGRQELAAFGAVSGVWLLVRLLAPETLALPEYHIVLGRGPFRVEDETALLVEHRIDVVVTKESGGTATSAKLAAARALSLPVLMIRRPPGLVGVETVTEVAAAVEWVGALSGTMESP